MAHITASELAQMRRNAKRLARAKGVSYSQALDQEAARRGFQNWSLLMKNQDATDTPLPAAAPIRPAAPAPHHAPLTPAQIREMMGLPRMAAASRDKKTIMSIVKRFADIVGDRVEVLPLQLMMDIEACHANGCPLDLDALLEAPRESDLVHDVAGIQRYLNRETGKLGEGFTPRYAVSSLGSLGVHA